MELHVVPVCIVLSIILKLIRSMNSLEYKNIRLLNLRMYSIPVLIEVKILHSKIYIFLFEILPYSS